MPIVNITLIQGRSPEKKAALMKSVTEAVVASIGAPAESVRVIINEVPPEHFAVAGVAKSAPSGS